MDRMNVMHCVREVQNMVFPIFCRICGTYMYWRHPICRDCLRTIDPVAPVDIAITDTRVMSVAAASRYEGHVARMIVSKHRGDVAAMHDIGWLMACRCASFLSQVDVLVVIPLHWWRYAQRGFNQAEIIAERLSRDTGIPWVRALRRTTWHSSQAGQSHTERYANVHDAFAVTTQASRIAGQRVAIIDDVMASGATLKAAARVLNRARAQQVYAVVGARTV